MSSESLQFLLDKIGVKENLPEGSLYERVREMIEVYGDCPKEGDPRETAPWIGVLTGNRGRLLLQLLEDPANKGFVFKTQILPRKGNDGETLDVLVTKEVTKWGEEEATSEQIEIVHRLLSFLEATGLPRPLSAGRKFQIKQDQRMGLRYLMREWEKGRVYP